MNEETNGDKKESNTSSHTGKEDQELLGKKRKNVN